MDNRLLQQLLSSELTEEERSVGLLQPSDVEPGLAECRASVFARVLTERNVAVNMKGFTATMSKAWGSKDLRLNRISHNVIQAFFSSHKEAQRVLHSGPWNFENNLVVLRPWERGVRPTEDYFNTCSFWIQVHHLPAEFMTQGVASIVADMFPGSEGIELREDGDMTKFFRVKAPVSLTAPVRRMIRLKLEDLVVTGVLAYERFPNHCYHCGILGHLIRSCPAPGTLEEKRKDCRFAIWAKAVVSSTKLSFKSLKPQDGFVVTKDAGHTPARGLFQARVPQGQSVDSQKDIPVSTPSEASFDVLVGSNHPVGPNANFQPVGLASKRLSFSSIDMESPGISESLQIFGVTKEGLHVGGQGGDELDGCSSNMSRVLKGKDVFPMFHSPPSASLPQSGKPPAGKKRKVFDVLVASSGPSLSIPGLAGAPSNTVSAEAVGQPRRSP